MQNEYWKLSACQSSTEGDFGNGELVAGEGEERRVRTYWQAGDCDKWCAVVSVGGGEVGDQ